MTETKRCQWGVTGYVSGQWVGIQCDGDENHNLRIKSSPGNMKRFDHANPKFGAFWNETDENASPPDDLMKPPVPQLDLTLVPAGEKPEPKESNMFLVQIDHGNSVIEIIGATDDKMEADRLRDLLNIGRVVDMVEVVPTRYVGDMLNPAEPFDNN
jgi:hypothetical protein